MGLEICLYQNTENGLASQLAGPFFCGLPNKFEWLSIFPRFCSAERDDGMLALNNINKKRLRGSNGMGEKHTNGSTNCLNKKKLLEK